MSTEVANRAVACKGWRWMPGMLTVGGARVGHTSGGSGYVHTWEEDPGCVVETSGYLTAADLPDLTDAATVGCLLALVREVWGDNTHAERWFVGPGWSVWLEAENNERTGATEAEALVAALESAP